MFEKSVPSNLFEAGVNALNLIYVCTVYNVRKSDGNAALALFKTLGQAAIFMLVMILARELLGTAMPLIRGEYFVFMLTGIFLFLMHTKTMMSVGKADKQGQGMTVHAPMSSLVTLFGGAFEALYLNMIAFALLVLGFHVLIRPIDFYDPIGLLGMVALAWYTGVCVGVFMWGLTSIAPRIGAMFKTIYRRIQMVASGKMFVANTLPASMVEIFSWNPLFHVIDQSRGYAFVNYVPRNSDATYALKAGTALLVIGLLFEFYTRKFNTGALASS